jgi:Histidine kinase
MTVTTPRPSARQVAAVVLGVAAAIQAWAWLESGPKAAPDALAWGPWAGRALVHTAMVLCMAAATLRAERAVEQGWRPLPAHGLALLAGATAAAVLHHGAWLATEWFLPPRALRSEALGWALTTKCWLDHLLWGSIFFWVHAAMRQRGRAAARMKALQMARSDAQRRAVQMELQALQARVEPSFLFGTLARIRSLYDTQPQQAGPLLDRLVDYLRAALPQLREGGSTLGRELHLARAYLDLKLPPGHAQVAAVPPALQGLPLAPMLLLPLLARLPETEPPADSHVAVTAHTEAQALHVRITAPGQPPNDDAFQSLTADLRARLVALHGPRAALRIEPGPGTRIVLTVPLETPP